jgi:hypothetical protein
VNRTTDTSQEGAEAGIRDDAPNKADELLDLAFRYPWENVEK